jgi:3-hydroxyacyl-[acyl-carrier-protein] dehydratase
MHFSLVDRITALEPGKSISALKNLSLAEEYLQDHFPGFPVMPGVLMVETLVQSAAWLMRATTGFQHSTILLKQAKAVKFNNFVTPGRTLVVTATVHEWGERECVFKGSGTVDGASAVSARITLEQFNLGDTSAAMADADRMRIERFRSQFARLWSPPATDQTGNSATSGTP